MRIKKNGKVVNLTESDLQRIVKKVLVEQALAIDPTGGIGASIERSGLRNIVQGEPSECGTYTGSTLLEKFKCCAYKIDNDNDALDDIKDLEQAALFVKDNGFKYINCMGVSKKSY